MSDASPVLPFTHSKLPVERTLKTFEDYLGWVLRSTDICYTPDWRKRHNRMQDREPQDTPEDRALWFRFILGTAMAYGMDLPTTSNPDPVELVPAVARWAHGALLHIQNLQRDIARLHGERLAVDLAHQQKQAASAQQIAELTGRLNRSEETLREANARGDVMADKVRELHQELREVREQSDRTVDKLKVQIEALASEVKRADSERDAWRMTASATSTALETLRAALRIPAGPVTGPPQTWWTRSTRPTSPRPRWCGAERPDDAGRTHEANPVTMDLHPWRFHARTESTDQRRPPLSGPIL